MENHQNINIMVCDDDREIAGAIEIYLRNEGYNVFKAFDGVEALNTARRENLHLIIMDVMMPQMDGIPVSYTHLDVYKRQDHRSGEHNLRPGI